MDFELRLLTVVVFVLWQGYWKITERKADREKPKQAVSSKLKYIKQYWGHYIFYAILCLQLFGWDILPMTVNLQKWGFLFVLIGAGISISARKTLGTNWAHAAEYQIKKHQSLTTDGIYRYIRNPIYIGLLIGVTGAELVAQSYLVIFVFLFGFLIAYTQAKREEKILEEHFGKEYLAYKKRSKMLIPFVF